MNNINLIGRLTRDAELRFLQNGTAVCNFSIAVDKGVSKEKKAEMEAQNKYTADFINIVAWGKQGENIAKYMTKGSQIGIQGRVETGSYDHKDGSKRYTFEVVAEKSFFLDSMSDNASSGNKTQQGDTGGFEGDSFSIVDDSQIPF